ncbi:hypothetical protein V8D89_003161 [Ganoderma adspersum]
MLLDRRTLRIGVPGERTFLPAVSGIDRGHGSFLPLSSTIHTGSTALRVHKLFGSLTALLETIFTEFEGPRIARTSELVNGARGRGELRVVSGVEACKKRNAIIEEKFGGGGTGMRAQVVHQVGHPFKAGESEI